MAISEELPIYHLPDGREFITAIDMVEHEHVRAFVKRFPEYWTVDPLRDGVIGPTPEERRKLLKQGYKAE